MTATDATPIWHRLPFGSNEPPYLMKSDPNEVRP